LEACDRIGQAKGSEAILNQLRLSGHSSDDPAPGSGSPAEAGSLARNLCQVVGLNQNYASAAGTLYHIQIEDRGPVLDRVTEKQVRRVNVIVYANYGEANARIVHGRDHDFEDLRTQEHNRFIEQRIQDLAAEARQTIEEKEQRQVMRIKCLIREYYLTKEEATKKEFEEANTLYPFLFSRAWLELRRERSRPEAGPTPEPLAALEVEEAEAAPEDVLYPLDADLRQRVIEIERLIIDLGQDLQSLKARGSADDILLQTCRKLVSRAKETISGRQPAEFTARRLDMTRNSLMTTWKQIKSRLRSA
jgi:hypothetical protein